MIYPEVMLRVSENSLRFLLKCHSTNVSMFNRLLSTQIKEGRSSIDDAGIIPDGTINERPNHYIEGITKGSDLDLLEKGIRKTDEMTSNFTNYMYKFHRLPPTMEVTSSLLSIRNFKRNWMG